LKLGILKTGAPPAALSDFGTYPTMFRTLLGEQAFDYEIFDVEAGELPASVTACPAYLLTGSACGAYDPLPWIAELTRFLKAAKGKASLVGICFGHQIMAQAFGGKVVQSPKGWGVGAHTYRVERPQPWLGAMETITLPASHQDQVVEPPPAAKVLAASAFTPFGMLAYADQPAISLQLHPEFDAGYAAALVELRRDQGLTDAQADEALASLAQPLDKARVATAIIQFLHST
jgi:GMP synthase-like glutamine amidotransferase